MLYQIISQADQAINASNSALSPTWAASTAPIRTLMTDEPACMELIENVVLPDQMVVVVVGSAEQLKAGLEKIAPVTVIKAKE